MSYFLIDDLAAIEAKNWDCFSGKGYDVTLRDMRNQVFLKFGKYPGFKRILIIGKPNWNGGKEYLIANGFYIIELGFQVTWETEVLNSAYEIIKQKLDTILYLPYPLFQLII